MTTSMQLSRLCLVSALAGVTMGAAACGGGAEATTKPSTTPVAQTGESSGSSFSRKAPVRERGGKQLTVEVGPSGGTLELGNGARLEIPQGALSDTVEITFGEGRTTSSFNNKEYEKAIGPIVQVSPAVPLAAPLMFSVPVSSIPKGFAPSDIALAAEVMASQQRGYMTDNAIATRWDYWPAAGNDGRASASLDELPGMRLQFVVSRDEEYE